MIHFPNTWVKRLPPNEVTTIIATHPIQITNAALADDIEGVRTALKFQYPIPGGKTEEVTIALFAKFQKEQATLSIDLEPPETYSFRVDGPNGIDLVGEYDHSVEATVPDPPTKTKSKAKQTQQTAALGATDSVQSVASDGSQAKRGRGGGRSKKTATG